MSGTQLWLSEPIPNDDMPVTGLELATLWLRVLHPNHCAITAGRSEMLLSQSSGLHIWVMSEILGVENPNMLTWGLMEINKIDMCGSMVFVMLKYYHRALIEQSDLSGRHVPMQGDIARIMAGYKAMSGVSDFKPARSPSLVLVYGVQRHLQRMSTLHCWVWPTPT